MYHVPEWYSRLRDVGMLWQALAGVMLFWGMLPRRERFKLRCGLFWIAGALGLLLARRAGWLEQGANVYIVYLMCVSMVFACRRVSAGTAWMVGGTGYLAQHICGNLELAFRTIPSIDRFFGYSNRVVLLDVVCYSAVYALIWRLFRNNGFRESEETSTLQKVMYSLLAALFSLGFYSINQYIRGWEQLGWIEMLTNSLYAAMGGVFLLAMQYGIARRQRITEENQAMRTLLYTQAAQWRDSLEHTELVNEKYHDLKKLLGTFRGKIDVRHLDELSEAIDAYDDHLSTGSQVADVVLTEARERCRKHKIQFTSYVNGADLSFLDDMELYSLLKNALDNAVGAVQELPEGRERFIALTTHRDGEMVLLHTENPCGKVSFEDGLPQTRQDADYHGFGMKSMMRVAAKYGGALTCSVKEGVFYLDVMLMKPQ